MGPTFSDSNKEGKLANELLATIRTYDWSAGGVDAWSAIVALSMVLKHITEFCEPDEDMRE